MRRRAGVVTPARVRTLRTTDSTKEPRDRVHARLVRDRDGRTRPIQSAAGETRSMHDDGSRTRGAKSSSDSAVALLLWFGVWNDAHAAQILQDGSTL